MMSRPAQPLSVRLFELACAAGALGCSTCSRGASTAQEAPPTVNVAPAVIPQHREPPPEQAAAPSEPAASDKLCPDADWQPLQHLKPAEQYDYVAIMERLSIGAGPATMRWAIGEACATAQARQDCQRELDRLAKTVSGGRMGTGQIQSQHYLVTTRGNEVKAWTSREDWLSFLGRIDTPQEALLLAWYDLYSPSCVEASAEGYRVTATKMTKDCAPVEITEYQLKVSSTGELSVQSSRIASSSPMCVGRRPLELHAAARPGSGTAHYFSEMARLEGAAVFAFRKLADQLREWGAPSGLSNNCEQAAREEVRHTRLAGRLALALGAVPDMPAFAEPRHQSLGEAALENAVEGCVRETFGALVGTYQSRNARARGIRRIMSDVARDERRHAALSWRLQGWFETQLSAEQRRELRAARAIALSELRDSWRADPDPVLMREAGLPSAAVAQRLLDGLQAMT